ncbi:hypothetical protein FRP1_04680 [Pseudonocardia sp. EC080625-04]|nr:hypothetical protein FRP1_04680 [Pseudonocardia sp. EC080625-04]
MELTTETLVSPYSLELARDDQGRIKAVTVTAVGDSELTLSQLIWRLFLSSGQQEFAPMSGHRGWSERYGSGGAGAGGGMSSRRAVRLICAG